MSHSVDVWSCQMIQLWVLTLAFWWSPIQAFNLEPRVSIVKEGISGSYFGFSVAPHQIVSQNRLESTLLVGAPLEGQDGALWKCPLTSKSDDCVRVRSVPRQSSRNNRNHNKYIDGGEWLGSTVRSQGPGKTMKLFYISIFTLTYLFYWINLYEPVFQFNFRVFNLWQT